MEDLSEAGSISEYVGLHWLPYFGNCKGSDSYTSFAKITEDVDPGSPRDLGCELVDDVKYPRAMQIFINLFTGQAGTGPIADTCLVPRKGEEVDSDERNDASNEDGFRLFQGVHFKCYYEEEIEIPQSGGVRRW